MYSLKKLITKRDKTIVVAFVLGFFLYASLNSADILTRIPLLIIKIVVRHKVNEFLYNEKSKRQIVMFCNFYFYE